MGRLLETVARWMIWCAGLVLFATAFLVVADILLRKFVHYSIPATDEISACGFAFATSWAYAHVAVNNANIRIDFPYMLLSRWLRLAADVLAMASIAALLLWLSWRGLLVAEVSNEIDTRVMNPLRLPLAIFQLLWAFGLFMGAVAALLALFRLAGALLRRDFDAAERLGGGSASPEERALV